MADFAQLISSFFLNFKYWNLFLGCMLSLGTEFQTSDVGDFPFLISNGTSWSYQMFIEKVSGDASQEVKNTFNITWEDCMELP